jgi:hypothetical protein
MDETMAAQTNEHLPTKVEVEQSIVNWVNSDDKTFQESNVTNAFGNVSPPLKEKYISLVVQTKPWRKHPNLGYLEFSKKIHQDVMQLLTDDGDQVDIGRTIAFMDGMTIGLNRLEEAFYKGPSPKR